MHYVITLLLCLFAMTGLTTEKPLVIYNWSEYMPQIVLDRFSEEYGIEIQYSTYENNEAMYAKVKALRGAGYDLLVPSTYYLDRMHRDGLLQKIDKKKLKNYGNLNPKLLNHEYDPNNEYSIPYLWGTTGIAINSAVTDETQITAWADLWQPTFKNKVLLLDDMREVFGMGLKVLGYSANSKDEKQIQAAYEKLRELLPNVRLFNAASPKDPLLAEEVTVGMLWNGESYMASQENETIRYIYPKEGVNVWIDSLVIPSGALNVAAAYQFIDFILRPEIAKIITEEIGYSSPNLEAIKLLDEEVRTHRTVYPTDEDLRNSEFQTDVGNALPIYEKYWQRLKARR